jgi:hypothetical protein
MRPNQNNKRMRGRNNNNNNRKGPNPLSRSYESNGPDVKIRGTAHHIGEKYLQLARDAQSSGDPVMAESYLQHAEHYFRLIAAAQQAQQQPFGNHRPAGEIEAEDAEEDDDFVSIPDRFASPVVNAQPQQNQPYPQQQPQPQPQPQHGNNGNGHSGFVERPQYPERRPDRNFQDRQPFPERQGNPQNRGDQRGGRGPRDYRPDNGQRYERHDQRPEDLTNKNLPAFITAPVRLQPETSSADEEEVSSGVMDRPEVENETGGYHLRARRRRRGGREDFGATEPAKDSFED